MKTFLGSFDCDSCLKLITRPIFPQGVFPPCQKIVPCYLEEKVWTWVLLHSQFILKKQQTLSFEKTLIF